MKNIFKDHPNKVGETYFEHFLKAFGFGIKLMLISLRVFIHAIFPWCFEHSTSDRIKKLNDILQDRKNSVNSGEN
jgi:hypothetical protein